MIQFEKVSVIVDDFGSENEKKTKILLHPFDLKITESRVVVIGANGSGKSTLLKLLNGLILPTTGKVLVSGYDTVRQGREVRRQVGYIFTDPLSQLVMSTPVDDVELSLRASIRNRKERREKAVQLLNSRGLGKVANQSIYDLSGGERQLVSLTTVLAIEPKVIVADEPTTLLDLKNRQELRNAFKNLTQQLIISTHDLELASDAERAILVDAGQIIADGIPLEVIKYYREKMLG